MTVTGRFILSILNMCVATIKPFFINEVQGVITQYHCHSNFNLKCNNDSVRTVNQEHMGGCHLCYHFLKPNFGCDYSFTSNTHIPHTHQTLSSSLCVRTCVGAIIRMLFFLPNHLSQEWFLLHKTYSSTANTTLPHHFPRTPLSFCLVARLSVSKLREILLWL